MTIKFGTSGWRGLIARDFTFTNVRFAAQGIAEYLKAELADSKSAIHGRKPVEHVIDIAEEDDSGGSRLRGIANTHDGKILSALACATLFLMGGKDSSHHLCGYAQQLCMVSKVDTVLAYKPEVGLIDQGGGL